MQFLFEAVRYDEPLPVYYLDNVLLYYTDSQRSPASLDLDENEICSFEKEYQQYVVMPVIAGAGDSLKPVLSLNEDPAYAKNGRSLRMYIPHGSVTDRSWHSISFAADFLRQVDFGRFDLDDELVFDLYNASAEPFSMGYILTDGGSSGPGKKDGRTANLMPGQWTEVRQPLREIAEDMAAALSDEETQVEPSAELLSDISYFTLINGEFPGSTSSDDRVLYLDSFRIEKA